MATTTTDARLLIDAFSRIGDTAHAALDGLTTEEIGTRVGGANSIAWLIWHLARVQDDHVADVAGTEQRWTADGWADRFALPFDATETGYGQTSDEVDAMSGASAAHLLGYLDAVQEATIAFVGGSELGDLERVVDEGWDPPVTLAVRLVSVLSDDLQHAGQASFARGIIIAGRSGR